MKKLTLLILMATCATVFSQTVTNTVTLPAPVDKFTELLNRVETVLTGILAVVSVLLGWWAQNRSKVAALVPPLIKSIETHGSDELKAQVSKAAGAIGVEPDMAKAVAANTSAPIKVDDFPPKQTITIPAFQKFEIAPIANLPPVPAAQPEAKP